MDESIYVGGGISVRARDAASEAYVMVSVVAQGTPASSPIMVERAAWERALVYSGQCGSDVPKIGDG